MNAPHFGDHEPHLRAIIDAALRAADPSRCVGDACRAAPPPGPDFAVLAAGKAGVPMLEGLRAAFPGERAEFVIAPEGGRTLPAALLGDHPFPSDRNARNGASAKRFVEGLAAASKPDGLVVLLSGGASALLSIPVPGLDPDEYRGLIETMLRTGRTIQDLNCIRKHCDTIKGGRFARFLGRLWCHVYVLSDVIGDALDAIGSGPFAPDPTTFDDAARIITEMPGSAKAWPTIWKFISRGVAGQTNDTPKGGEPFFDRVRHVIVANNTAAVDAAGAEAARLGYAVGKEHAVLGDAAEVGRRLAADARGAAGQRPACIIRGGETTVKVGDGAGHGGRNQELALAVAIGIDGATNVAIAAFATDGVDGPTDAAGAIVTGDTCARARAQGCDPADFLNRHDSYSFFGRIGGHVKTGPTGTNVNDLAIALLY